MHLRLLGRANLSAAAAPEEIQMHHFHEKKKSNVAKIYLRANIQCGFRI